MSFANRLRIAASWEGKRRALALEAAVELLRASALVRFAPFRVSVRSSASPLGERMNRDPTGDVRWAIDLASRNLPWRIVCFQRGLAAQAMLRRRGIDARLHYGAGLAEGDLAAHVWVTVGERIVIGEDEAADHRCMAVFP